MTSSFQDSLVYFATSVYFRCFSFLPVLNMFVISLILLILSLSCGQTVARSTALRFGQTTADYIQLSDGIMDSSRTRFSLCTWIKKRFTGSSYPVVLDNYNNIVLGDDGNWHWVAGTNAYLQSEFQHALNTWFHVCMTWSNEDRRIRVYLDGRLVGTSGVTFRSELVRGKETCLGNVAGADKYIDRVFGGDLFKLNIYNRVLTETEIMNMASDMCSKQEEQLRGIKLLTWDQVLLNERSGNVSEIQTRCEDHILSRELAGLRKRLINLEGIYNEVLIELQSTNEELAGLKEKTSSLEAKLVEAKMVEAKQDQQPQKKQDQYLIAMITMGGICTISLILLIFLLLKQMRSKTNRSSQENVISEQDEDPQVDDRQDETQEATNHYQIIET